MSRSWPWISCWPCTIRIGRGGGARQVVQGPSRSKSSPVPVEDSEPGSDGEEDGEEDQVLPQAKPAAPLSDESAPDSDDKQEDEAPLSPVPARKAKAPSKNVRSQPAPPSSEESGHGSDEDEEDENEDQAPLSPPPSSTPPPRANKGKPPGKKTRSKRASAPSEDIECVSRAPRPRPTAMRPRPAAPRARLALSAVYVTRLFSKRWVGTGSVLLRSSLLAPPGTAPGSGASTPAACRRITSTRQAGHQALPLVLMLVYTRCPRYRKLAVSPNMSRTCAASVS
ncbi:hypothetical protein B0H17DRAFT_1183986 [Mycena rosella]|uniref:Uncharacterized protein n=1 Tax=Mycena rosella TaxID=1033263 RepID=A0AAD7CXL9_MYCRO|nr:hypothetical protein B0H17DRAFT_1183986 [Mycena rosella]